MNGQFTFYRAGNERILYDAGLVTDEVKDDPCLLFSPDYHTKQQARQNPEPEGGGIGRARVLYFSCGQNPDQERCVLKHYHRGGLVARLSKDRYWGRRAENSRAFREYRLLKAMHTLGLPVPVAVAARVSQGLLLHRADLVTREIENVRTLSDLLSRQTLDRHRWQAIGRCIRRFHQHHIYHADLNARNILLRQDGEIFLIDFDNSYVRQGGGNWQAANLARLQRSLRKFRRQTKDFNFSDADWKALLSGY